MVSFSERRCHSWVATISLAETVMKVLGIIVLVLWRERMAMATRMILDERIDHDDDVLLLP